jgi:DNA-directed RNA polymerase specialized sigma24 family protein
MSTESITEDSVEARTLAYFDFTYATAFNFLKNYANAYGFDARVEAQDIAQEVAFKTINGDAYGPSLGASYFKVSAENLCKNFLKARTNDTIKGAAWGSNVSWVEQPEQAGYLDLWEAVKRLSKAQQIAVMERYYGYPDGTLSGTKGTAMALMRARAKITESLNIAA